MALDTIFGIAASSMNSQLIRMNTTASNLANASTVSGTSEGAYKAKRPVFQAILEEAQTNAGFPVVGGVKVSKIIDDKTPGQQIYDPGNPTADAKGYVYKSNVNEMSEMVEMMGAARSYQNSVEVVNTARDLMMRTVDMLKG